MIGIISALAGVLGMLGMLALWSLAWWLWKQAAVLPAEPSRARRPGWPNQAIPRRTPSIPPPSWLFDPGSFGPGSLDGPEGDAAPSPREHPSSSANTSRYTREQIDRARAAGERTELLADEPSFEQDQAPSVTESQASGTWPKAGLVDDERTPTGASAAPRESRLGGETCKIGLFAGPGVRQDE
ncbi:MAG: hypothetical protein R6X02_31710 [Enhygromyxa sp.]